MIEETQNTVFAAAVKSAAMRMPNNMKRGKGRLVPLSVIKASAFARSDWDVFQCMVTSAIKAGCLRTIMFSRVTWVVL